jgi:hypothetical protein
MFPDQPDASRPRADGTTPPARGRLRSAGGFLTLVQRRCELPQQVRRRRCKTRRVTIRTGEEHRALQRGRDHTRRIAGAPFERHVSGSLAIRMDDGTEFVARPGDITSLPSGHDAWVVGDEPAVVVDWFGASHYARGA